MDTNYPIHDSAIEVFDCLLEEDYDYLQNIEELGVINEMKDVMDLIAEDYKDSEEYDPELAFIVGKHLEELGKHFKKAFEHDAMVIIELADDDYNPYGNSVTVGVRNNWSYDGDERLEQLDKDYDAIRKSRNSRKKKLRNSGEASKNPSRYLQVSKS